MFSHFEQEKKLRLPIDAFWLVLVKMKPRIPADLLKLSLTNYLKPEKNCFKNI